MADEAHAPAPPAAQAEEGNHPITAGDLRATVLLFGIFLANIALAVLFEQPFAEAGLQAFEDPEDVGNTVWYIALILLFTLVILYIAKRGIRWLIRLIILGAVVATLVYVLDPLLVEVYGVTEPTALVASIAFGALCALALWKHPEWYVLDIVGLLVAAASAAIFGISLGLVPVVILLAALAIYDAIAVYRTKHMLSLADTVIELRLPVLLVIPKIAHYSFRKETTKVRDASEKTKGERDALFMGLGDLVMPTILVVSALHFGLPRGWGTIPAAGAAVGTLLGFGLLMYFVLKGRPHAGLPLLNGGSILGFLVGLYYVTGSIVFW